MPRNLRLIKGDKQKPQKRGEEKSESGADLLPVYVPEPPDFLEDDEAVKFREVAAKLAKMRLMTEADSDALAIYAQTWCRYLDATAKVREMGMIVKSPNNFPMQNPYLSIANKAQSECTKILSEFGLTPSSRTRVTGR